MIVGRRGSLREKVGVATRRWMKKVGVSGQRNPRLRGCIDHPHMMSCKH